MASVEILIGFPASGKSTYAKNTGKLRINNDDLRIMLHDGEYSPANEKQVNLMRNAMLREALRKNIDVVIDNTNLNPKVRQEIMKICAGHEVIINDSFLDVDVDECIRRDKERQAAVGASVIKRMSKQWEAWKDAPIVETEAWEPVVNQGDYDAWIVDIDGTLADHTGLRSPYEFWKVKNDRPIRPVCRLVYEYLKSGGRVFFFSGRDDSCEQDTLEWLDKHIGFPRIDPEYYDEYDGEWVNWSLHMRKTGDKRKDDIVKSEMFDAIIEPSNHEVSIVIDDRKGVKRMWVARGLFVLDVNQNDEDF